MQDTLYHEMPTEVESEIYIPTDEEAAEMLEMYAIDYDACRPEDDVIGGIEPNDDPEQDEFDEWLVNLPDRDLATMRRAIDDIRRILRSSSLPLPVPVLAGWIDLD
jgi:hypothetical protein